jgi:hypothetical protein
MRATNRIAKETVGEHLDAEITVAKTYFRQLAEDFSHSASSGLPSFRKQQHGLDEWGP